MKMFKTLGLCSLISVGVLANTALSQDVDLENEDNRIAYSIGVNIGQNLVQQGLLEDLDFEAFAAGMSDMVNGDIQLTDEQIFASIQAFQQRMVARQNAAADAARASGEEFLAANAENDDVVVLESGLQYEVLESGDAGADSPGAADAVLAHYHGTLIDGSVFDSSVDRGQPAQFAVNQVIAGWTEALQLMKVGDKWRLYIPYNLAYGEQGIPGTIPPFATLIFEVELLEVQ